MSVDLVSDGMSVLLDTRIVYRNGGNCGDLQGTLRIVLRDGNCSTGSILYGCTARPNQPCTNSIVFPHVVVDVEPSVDVGSPSEYYRFRLQVTNVPVDANTTYCAVLDTLSPTGVVGMVAKRFNVMYRG